ncbi:hypothetical protein Nepgr_003845 [Nepenthes gracilis]|uniref:Uncharacterized protein n=1 Tax=Nepenthes gracilis TaxID=150966 RepID=A0AAD3S0A1_NEPGR|nr:hypothetical protein Nepgr_003845 [Nepenthes gracilis]
MSMTVRWSSTPHPHTKKCRSCIPSSPDSYSPPQVFRSDYCKEDVGSRHSVNHAMPCSSMGSSIPIEILTFESEQIDVKSASSSICCEGFNSDAIGCHLDSSGFIPVELLHVQDGYLGTQESGAEVLP